MLPNQAEVSLLECKDLTKCYVSGRPALDHFNLNIEAGHIVGLLGPNGSGKTTLIKLLNGLLTPTGGEILIRGQKPGIASRAIVSYLPERTYLEAESTVEKLVGFFADFYADFDRERANAMLTALAIDPKSQLKSLSKGTKEKVQLILVMARQAQLYVLDEPIAGVDPAARDFIIRTILANYNPNATILICTHLITDIEQILDDFVFIKNGRLVAQAPVSRVRENFGITLDRYFREVFAYV
ncbi:MAG: ABC transporter ATP-binding protein [Lachnospiraceae bacterium]|nr:ABC transporter ATP-binding protein [Lachnospiraceae bacterium]